MTALKNKPTVVTFLMNEKHGNAVLEYLNTDDGLLAASRKRIEKLSKTEMSSRLVNINFQ